ncbi:MAG: class I SAM-dependent methyltransferase [Chloroflexi bacterium]|nr:class I SAM-dependent methyltransferase [Chloroflexota bacterium]
MYDDFSQDYDRFVDWPGRLAVELPFLEARLKEGGARRVLDAACGTGMHALALAERGYEAAGADVSPGMIQQAQANAAGARLSAQWAVAAFGELKAAFPAPFDAVLCLGNSLPHVLTPAALAETLSDFAACLRPGGLLLVQNRNFDAVLRERQRWMEPQGHRSGDREWLFLRFYDFEADGQITFHVVRLQRQGDAPWSQAITSTRLWPQQRADLEPALQAAGFGQVTLWGNLQGAPFRPESSPNLVLAARRGGCSTGDDPKGD